MRGTGPPGENSMEMRSRGIGVREGIPSEVRDDSTHRDQRRHWCAGVPYSGFWFRVQIDVCHASGEHCQFHARTPRVEVSVRRDRESSRDLLGASATPERARQKAWWVLKVLVCR